MCNATEFYCPLNCRQRQFSFPLPLLYLRVVGALNQSKQHDVAVDIHCVFQFLLQTGRRFPAYLYILDQSANKKRITMRYEVQEIAGVESLEIC
ncbi:hypothetical protein CDAR_412941 [Caerostris darwini]|uniref:Uncharacterized protein n=1 Tax=Caerostris darwini TaxID=1538125 RepID=A0AAV4PJ94_9ARAC|nr:hypothetical protein CDAR_412941 [Caerostris darwini]